MKMKDKKSLFDDIDAAEQKDIQKTTDESVELAAKTELLLFLKSQIKNVTKENNLKESIIKDLNRRIEDTDNPLPPLVLIRALEVLSKSDNEVVNSILGVLKQQQFVINNNTNGNSTGRTFEDEERSFSKDDFNTYKKVHQYISLLKKAEIPEED